jgi:hypothetical protein
MFKIKFIKENINVYIPEKKSYLSIFKRESSLTKNHIIQDGIYFLNLL